MSEGDELRALAGVPTEHTCAGEVLKLRPMKLLQSLKAREIGAPFFAEMADGTANVTHLMNTHATRVFDLAVVMLGDDRRAWLGNLEDEQEYEALLAKLIEINSAFFARRVRDLAMQTLLNAAAVGSLTHPGPTTEMTPPSEDSQPDGLTPSQP